MTANHLLDAMGLLDDELIQQAEEYTRGKGKNYGKWMAWAASFAVVLVLGYGLTHLNIGMGGGGAWSQPGGQQRPQRLLRRRGNERCSRGRRPVRH